MDIINQSFIDKKTGTIHTILNVNNGVALTDNIEKIPVPKLLDSSLYTPYSDLPINESKNVKVTQSDVVDPNNFFNNPATYNLFAEKIRSVDTSKMKEDEPQVASIPVKDLVDSSNNLGVDNSINAVYTSSAEDEMAEVARKYGAALNNNQSIQKQNEAFSKYLEDEEPIIRVDADTHQIEEPTRKTEVRVNNQNTEVNTYVQPEKNPIHSVFDQAKRSLPFTAIINQSGYIPRLDFIELMEDSYETSIIDYLANDYVNKLLGNPEELKNQIKSQIISLLDKNKKPKKVAKKVDKPKVVKSDEPKITKTNPIVEEKPKKTRTTTKKQDVK